MKVTEIISFMNPIGDALAIVFVSMLIILTLATIIWVSISANEKNWQKNWYGEDLDNNTDSDYSSINELSDAAATKAEKVADIMPSMLLIIGLLGTFIGLGIALNSASNALATVSGSNIDGAMTQLMSLMDGLGAKFKTSTWGILCFIVLNLFLNARGFSEKRLSWAIKKIRQQSNISKANRVEVENERINKLLATVNTLIQKNSDENKLLSQELKLGFNEFLSSHRNLHELSIANQNKIHNKSSELQLENYKLLSSSLNENFLKSLDKQEKLHLQALESQKEMFDQTTKTQEEFQRSVQKYFTNAVKGIQANQVATEQIQSKSEENLNELKKIAEYNLATQQSMQDFVSNTVDSMKSIGDSADKMSSAAREVGVSASGLNEVIVNLRNELESVMQMIKQDLGMTIENMGQSFEKNMGDMSSTMSQATKGISTAVNDLSTSVGQTMHDVTGAISKSMDLQTRSANEFTVTSTTLNEYIEQMNELVRQLSNDITSGLRAVSENGRRMESANKRFELSSDLVENLIQINQSFVDKLEKSSNYNANTINELKENNKQNQIAYQEVGSKIHSLLDMNTITLRDLINKTESLNESLIKLDKMQQVIDLLDQLNLSVKTFKAA